MSLFDVMFINLYTPVYIDLVPCIFYTVAKACAGKAAPEHAGLLLKLVLVLVNCGRVRTMFERYTLVPRGSTGAMIHRSCGFAARAMDHGTGENLAMIDFPRYFTISKFRSAFR